MSFVTTPVTNKHFHQRVVRLVTDYLDQLGKGVHEATTVATAAVPEPLIPSLTPKDTRLFPNATTNTYIAYVSPWIDLCSSDVVVANVSRQVLNLEVDYANFCGVRSIVIPGPRRDPAATGIGGQGLAVYARAVKEALSIGSRLNVLIHMPMYREPGLEESIEPLSSLVHPTNGTDEANSKSIDLFSCWSSWHAIRSVCGYHTRLYVGESGWLAPALWPRDLTCSA